MAGVCAPGAFCIVISGETDTNMQFNMTCFNGKTSTKVCVFVDPLQNRFGNELISRFGHNSMSASIFHTQAYTPPVFLKHVHPPAPPPSVTQTTSFLQPSPLSNSHSVRNSIIPRRWISIPQERLCSPFPKALDQIN